MQRLPAKNSIISASVVFVLVSAAVFGYLFPLFDSANTKLSEAVAAARKEYLEVQAEQQSVEQGKRDLATLAAKPVQPENFFSGDTSLVGEIKVLEDLAKSLAVDLDVSISGTAATAPKAKTTTDIRVIPFTIQVEGEYVSIIQFIEYLEHAKFVTYVKTVTINPAGRSLMSARLDGNFYIKK